MIKYQIYLLPHTDIFPLVRTNVEQTVHVAMLRVDKKTIITHNNNIPSELGSSYTPNIKRADYKLC